MRKAGKKFDKFCKNYKTDIFVLPDFQYFQQNRKLNLIFQYFN